MAGTSRGNVYNFVGAFVWRRNSLGLATGQLDPDSLTPGTTSHAYRIYGPITATLPDVTFKSFEFVGGGTWEGKADGGLESVGDGELQVSQMDGGLEALLQGGSVDTTSLANTSIWSNNSLQPSPRDVGLMLIAQIQDRSVAVGQTRYVHFIYPSVQMRTKSNNLTQDGGTNPSPMTLIFKPQKATTFPTGIAFGANQGWYENSEFSYRHSTQYPFALTTYVQNGSGSTFTTQFKPFYSTVTGGNTDNWYTVNGVATAPTSHSTSTALLTLAAAGTSGQLAIAMYQHNWQLSA